MVLCEFLSEVEDCYHCLVDHDLGRAVLSLFCRIYSLFELNFAMTEIQVFDFGRIEIDEFDCMDSIKTVITTSNFAFSNLSLPNHQANFAHAIAI